MSENKKNEGVIELTPELLEQVSGGVMNERAEQVMDALIKALKIDTAKTHTAEETIDFIINRCMDNPIFSGVTEAEIIEYINSRW